MNQDIEERQIVFLTLLMPDLKADYFGLWKWADYCEYPLKESCIEGLEYIADRYRETILNITDTE